MRDMHAAQGAGDLGQFDHFLGGCEVTGNVEDSSIGDDSLTFKT